MFATFDRVLAVIGLILAIILVVLDKAGKLKGPVLFVLLGIAAAMTIPLVFSIPWVANKIGPELFARRALMFSLVAVAYSLLCVWISGDMPQASKSAHAGVQAVATTPTTQTPAHQDRSPSSAIKPANAPHRTQEQQEVVDHLEEINDFICTKDEMELRNEFDFPNLLIYNLRFDRRNIAPQTVSAALSVDIDRYFTGGKGRVDLRYARVSSVNNTVDIKWIPGRIGVINTSVTYQAAREKLVRLYSSANTPSSIAAALKDLDDVIEKDSILLIESLNESLALDPRYITESETVGAPLYGSAQGAYWSKFIPLAPKADIVRMRLREYLTKLP